VRIAFVGAGSVLFTRLLVHDLLAFPALRDDVELVLHDVDPRRLEVAGAATRQVCVAQGGAARVRETLERRAALEGADYVVFTVQVGGHEATVRDFEIRGGTGSGPRSATRSGSVACSARCGRFRSSARRPAS
jgi:alpha-galactosidase